MQINDYHIFELVKGDDGFPKHGGVHWFNTYTEKSGKKRFIVADYNDEGKPIKKNVILTEDNPLMVHKQNEEMYKFLIEHPNFEGGKNYNGEPVFRLVDLERDAKQRTESKILQAKAIAHASQLSGNRLFEICSLYGAFFSSESEAQALEFIITKAELNPEQYLEYKDRGSRDVKIRYILATALGKGVVVKSANGAYKFGSLVIGVNEDNAVARLMTEIETFNAIATRVGSVVGDPFDEGSEDEEKEIDASKFVTPKSGRPKVSK
jgi:hypothetical protein